MAFTKHCPHCLKRIPIRKRFRPRCPYCFKAYRRHSGMAERGTIGLFLEDRSTAFWFLVLVGVFALLAMILQTTGHPTLLMFMDKRPIWFAITMFYLAMFVAIMGRMYFPLLLGAPKILRRERTVIRQYRNLTTAGLVLGVPFALLFTGFQDVWLKLPGTIFLFLVPTGLMWGYCALTLTEDDYEDERVWTFLQELGANDRLEHRHHGFIVLFGIPLAGAMFYYFMTHPVLARLIMESEESGLIAMFRELYNRTRGRMPNP
jgi:hypothetical protein